MFVNGYVTLERLTSYLINQKQSRNPLNSDDVRRFIMQASTRLDRECKRTFAPRLETRYYDHPPERKSNTGYYSNRNTLGGYITEAIYSSELKLDDDLLEVTTLTTYNGDETITASNYFLMTGHSYNYPPYDRIRLKSDGSQTTFQFSGTPQQSNSVTGFWGFHKDWNNAWVQIDTVQDNPLSASAITLTVADVDGTDEYGIQPRFQSLQLLRIGDDNEDGEYVFGTFTNPDTNTVTIVRGVNGTTAAQHAQNTNIYAYRPMEDVIDAMLALAIYSYRQKSNIGRPDSRPIMSPSGVLILPETLPENVEKFVSRYRKGRP